jgi:hypothetical protein
MAMAMRTAVPSVASDTESEPCSDLKVEDSDYEDRVIRLRWWTHPFSFLKSALHERNARRRALGRGAETLEENAFTVTA